MTAGQEVIAQQAADARRRLAAQRRRASNSKALDKYIRDTYGTQPGRSQ